MSAKAEPKMTVEEFFAWADGREGRWELESGAPVAMSPERVAHGETKAAAFVASANPVRRAGAPCRALPDGATVRVASDTAFEPDALVYCGPRLPRDAIEIPNPAIVVEELSPGTERRDRGVKLKGYFSLSSVMHYQILDPDKRMLIHHRRGQGDVLDTRILSGGILRLEPLGLDLPVAEMFAPED